MLSARRATWTIEGRQDGEDHCGAGQRGAIAWCDRARQHRSDQEPHQRRAASARDANGCPMVLARPGGARASRPARDRPDAAQAPSDESQAYRFRADAGKSVVHDAHRDADRSDGDPTDKSRDASSRHLGQRPRPRQYKTRRACGPRPAQRFPANDPTTKIRIASPESEAGPNARSAV